MMTMARPLRRGAVALAHLVALISATGCGMSGGHAAGGKPMFELAWTHRGQGERPAGAGALGFAVLMPDTVLFEGAALEAASGRERWTTADVLVGVDGGAAIVVRREGDRLTAIERRDARTGALAGQATIAAADGTARPLRSLNAGLSVAAGRLVYAHLGRIQAYAIDTGREAWTMDLKGTSSTVVPSGDGVGAVGGGELVVVSAADGAARWRVPVDDGTAVASPRGGFFVARNKRVVELDARGSEIRSAPGRFGAAHGQLLAVTDGDDIAVYDEGGREVGRIAPAGTGDYVAAPGLCDGAVVYFRNQGSTVWWHPLKGAERPVVKIEPKTGLADGKHVTAGATLTEAPRCTGSILLVQDWFVSAYRIPRS